jgi:hypothetical protein
LKIFEESQGDEKIQRLVLFLLMLLVMKKITNAIKEIKL